MTDKHAELLCFLGAGALAVALTPLAIRVAKWLGLVDLPGARKVHQSPIPRIGGVTIILATLIPFAVAIVAGAEIPTGGQFPAMIALIASAMCVGAFGFVDDLTEISAKYKLLVLVVAAAMFCGSGGVIRAYSFEGHTVFNLGMAAWPITMLWMVGVVVGINFIDGLDGLAAGIVAIACAVLGFCVTYAGNPFLGILPLALLGALLGFLVFNFHPAKVFMGDCGSMFVGFLFAGCCVLAQKNVGTTRGLFLPAIALAVPLFDTLFTFVRRGVLQRRSLFSAERGHIHHRLLDVGLHHKHVVIFLHAVTFLGAGVALMSLLGNFWATAVTAAGFLFVLGILFRVAGTVRARETLTAVRRNRAIGRETRRYRVAFEDLQLSFRDVRTFDGWWKQVCRSAEQLDFAKLNLPITRREGPSTILRWRRDAAELAQSDSITAEIPVPQRRAGQTLRIDVEVIVNEFLESAGNRLALFARILVDCSLKNLPDRIEHFNTADQPAPGAEAMPDPIHADVGPRDLTMQSGSLAGLRIAVVHDFLYTYAGAERVLEQLLALFPGAELFALFDFLPDHLRHFIQNKTVQTSFIQRMPFARRKHRAYLPLMPLAIEQLDVSSFDIVISSSYVVAKGVLTRPDQLHICYCHTPVRYAWDLQNQYLARQRGLSRWIKGLLARTLLHYMRSWDVRSSNSVDVFVTNSNFVGRRIQKVYRRSAATVYPPVDTHWFSALEKKEDFYVTASRLVPYKRIDLVVEAFSRMPDRRLLVIGEGPELEAIRLKAGKNISLLGYQPAARLRQYLQRARAFVFAAEEDFGIVPVEAQACGTPVIAFGRGGAMETVIPGITGILFNEQTPEAIIAAVQEFESQDWDAAQIRKNAERFSIRVFREQFADIVRRAWTDFSSNIPDRNRDSAPSSQLALRGPSAPALVSSIAAVPDVSAVLKQLERS